MQPLRVALRSPDEASSLRDLRTGQAGVRIISLMFPIALTSRTTWMPPNPSPWRWRKEGATVDRQRRDQAECAMASDPMHGGPRRHREQSQSSRPWSSVQADRLVRRRALCISSSANTRSHTPENMVNGRYQKRMGITVLAALQKRAPSDLHGHSVPCRVTIRRMAFICCSAWPWRPGLSSIGAGRLLHTF
jgi:hypothetical protein